MSIACISIPHLPYQIEVARNPHLRGQPVILVTVSDFSHTVLDVAPLIADVLPGMSLSEALSYRSDAVVTEVDARVYGQDFEAVLGAIEAQGFELEDAGPGLAFIQLDGPASMLNQADQLIATLVQAIPKSLTPRIGIADGKFVSVVAASMASPGSLYKAPSDTVTYLDPVTVDLLPVTQKIKRRLHSFGLHTLGQVAQIPIGPLQAQFGTLGKFIWELCCGIDNRPLYPRRHQEVIRESLVFPTPLTTLATTTSAIEVLLAKAFSRRTMQGHLARICTLSGLVFRASVWKKTMVFREPIGDQSRALPLIKHALEGHPPSGPLEDLTLVLSGLTGEVGRQGSLFPEVRRRGDLGEALAQLQARLGSPEVPIYQVRKVNPWSRIPERREVLVPYVP